MHSGSGKGGRGGGGGGGGGGRGGGRRSQAAVFPAPTTKRSLTSGGGVSSSGRVSSHGRKESSTEESFSLVSGKSSVFASIIRLAPDLVEEIKRVEAQGGRARIKFDSNASNPVGNVIEVGGKNFRFTWSHEAGGLCDIYDERRSGEDGGGLLVESGCAWRKLNVQRVLDESTKNHVKMRSEEAERKMKSRKAIVLEHGNPSMKSQMKAMAAVEVNPWKTGFKQWKEPSFKKRKVEQNQAGVISKPHKKSVPPLLPTIKHGSSPAASPRGFTSPLTTGGLNKGQAVTDSVLPKGSPVQENGKNTINSTTIVTFSSAGMEKGREQLSASTDLRSMLIALFMETPKGFTLKALEKAAGERIPKSFGKIEPIIKEIATFQPPGRYFLKPGIEVENFKKNSRENGSSPEDNYHHHHTTVEENHGGRGVVVVPPPIPAERISSINEAACNQVVLEEKPDLLQPVDKFDPSPHISPEKKKTGSNGGSPSESGSDSDTETDSSDSGSDSRSRSRSRGGSGTNSSSDSESDTSSNSKEMSEEDVEIMTSDDDKQSRPLPLTIYSDHGRELVENPHHKPPHTLVSSHFFKPATDTEISGRKPGESLDKGCKSAQNQYPSQEYTTGLEVQDKVVFSAGRKTPRNPKMEEIAAPGTAPVRNNSPETLKNDKMVRKSAHFVQEEAQIYTGTPSNGAVEFLRKSKSGPGIQHSKESTLQRNNAVEQVVVSEMEDVDRSWPFSKYEKKEPVMKIEIKDLHQYSDYVYEYREKYDSYRSVITILETYRDEFTRFGEELEISRNKDMDRFHAVLKKMNASFHKTAGRHKRLKKVLLVLHDELKSLKERMKDFASVYSRLE